MTLFAVTDIKGAEILRFNLSQSFEAEVEQSFENQHFSLLKGIDDFILYDGRYTPQEGELLLIDGFKDKEGLAGAAKNPLKIPIFEPKKHSLAKIKALFVPRIIDGNQEILIQHFEKRRVLSSDATYLKMVFSGNAFQKFEDEGLSLDNKLVASFDVANSQLVFQSFHFLSRSLDVKNYLVEATDQDVKDFANHNQLEVKDASSFLAGASKLQRKKIALILQSGILDKFTAVQLEQVAQTVNVSLNLNSGGQIIMPTKAAEIRRLLSFLEEDIYKSPLTDTLYQAGTKRKAS